MFDETDTELRSTQGVPQLDTEATKADAGELTWDKAIGKIATVSTLLLAVTALFAYLMALSYLRGYCAFFGIPAYFVNPGRAAISWIVPHCLLSLLVTTVSVVGVYWFVTWPFRRILAWLLRKIGKPPKKVPKQKRRPVSGSFLFGLLLLVFISCLYLFVSLYLMASDLGRIGCRV